MNYPTPYGKSDDLALENERLRGLVKELKGQRDTARRATMVQVRRVKELDGKIQELQDLVKAGEVTDGFHTFHELYEARMLYHAHAVVTWQEAGIPVLKSWRHHDGELCFGGGWFIVIAELPGGQISQHYRAEHWELFDCPEIDTPETPFDGHTTQDTHERLRDALGIEES